ncbi:MULTISPECIES: ABC transporter permease [Gordonia]|uniref:ABC transporter permease n=1 Tax=Gordonia TaxID=2053 RepID=UPI0019C1FB63|nr:MULTISPECIES: ABC transporter permease [Gordonia]MBD0020429.1 ABC transporter permease [Gordonia sp. (in: high G+C Gram-positive bacteria)]
MLVTRALLLSRHDAAWLCREPAPLVTVLITPALLVLFIKPLYADAVTRLGYLHGDGVQLAVPGVAVMFSFFLIGLVTDSYFREHGLQTWQRLRLSPVRTWEVLLGKSTLCSALSVTQTAFLFALGWTVVGLHITGSILALATMALALAACVSSFALALCAVSASRRQAFAAERVVTLTWTLVGGALVPTDLMPALVQWIAKATPVYWAVNGFRQVVLDGAALTDILPCLAAVLAFTAVFTAVALWRFPMDQERLHWT